MAPVDPLAALQGIRSPYGHLTLPDRPPTPEEQRKELAMLAQIKADILEEVARQAAEVDA